MSADGVEECQGAYAYLLEQQLSVGCADLFLVSVDDIYLEVEQIGHLPNDVIVLAVTCFGVHIVIFMVVLWIYVSGSCHVDDRCCLLSADIQAFFDCYDIFA